MMTTAEHVINVNPGIQKVIILEHPPRYDAKEVDPIGLKPELAKYANNVFHQLWFASKLKHKIVLGQHKLDCSEKARLARYTNAYSKKYDGIHMYGTAGRTAYTNSLISILSNHITPPAVGPRPRQSNYHKSCPQTKYTSEQKKHNNTRYSVPVNNRFSVLGN